MRPNLARRKLLAGGLISGPTLCFPCPEIAEEAVQYGFDFVWIDWQHGGWTETTINAAMPSFVNRDTVPIVRLPGMDGAWIGRVLDLGALGIVIPMVETAEQCEQIVRAAKFPPRGGRSATGLRTAYHAGHNYFDYTQNANNEILTVVMVETVKGVGNVRDMMKVPDIDCVLIGPYDLSRSVGAASMSDASVENLVQEVLTASKETGVAAGYVTNSPAEAETRAAEGFRLVCPGHDVIQLPEAFREMKKCSVRLAAR
ncbi:MAG: HpcH/HpaI aldolase family protein [Bryobacteraceae bacterium]